MTVKSQSIEVVRQDYECTREAFPEFGIPAWETLGDEARERMAAAFRRKREFFDALGDAIKNGTELPRLEYYSNK